MRARDRRWSPTSSWRTVSSALRLQPRASSGSRAEAVPGSVREAVEAPGRPLDPATRSFMEPRFGQDFSGVRVHTNNEAARSARDVSALAYTAGQNIVFAPGQYTPDTARGQHLLAHELAHVVQQRRMPAPDKDTISRPGDRDEVAAERASAAALTGQSPELDHGGGAHALQRQPMGPPAAAGVDPMAGPAKLPEKPKGEDEAIAAALEKAYDDFTKTKLGKELKEHAKSYILSVEGLPFDIFVVANVATFVAANDPKLPSLPAFEIGDGIKLKIDYQGRVSDLPPLMKQLFTQQHDPNRPIERDAQGQPKNETHIGFSVEFTWEAFADFVKGVGRFFAKAAVWFAKGIVKIGTVIGKGIAAAKHELIGAALGGALGAAIGGLAGGGIGALVGLGIGAAVGAGFGAIAHVLDNKRKKV
jgi:hypothetical protein